MKNLLLLIALLAYPQGAPPDYARALRPVVNAGIESLRKHSYWSGGPTMVDLDSFAAALAAAGHETEGDDTFRARTGFQRSVRRGDAIECTTEGRCGIREGGLHVQVDSVLNESESLAAFFVTMTVTQDRGRSSATCTVVMEIRAEVKSTRNWAAAEPRLLRYC